MKQKADRFPFGSIAAHLGHVLMPVGTQRAVSGEEVIFSSD